MEIPANTGQTGGTSDPISCLPGIRPDVGDKWKDQLKQQLRRMQADNLTMNEIEY
jgi:hypothetical protein